MLFAQNTFTEKNMSGRLKQLTVHDQQKDITLIVCLVNTHFRSCNEKTDV